MMSKRRPSKGSAITEFGPAMFLLLVVIFFPMLDMLGMGVGYVFSNIYHESMLRELALSSPPTANPDPAIQTQDKAIAKINTEFAGSGFFSFLKMSPSDLECLPAQILYLPDTTNPTIVQCTTSTTITPFISIPFWADVPGLNKPYKFTSTSQRPQEEKGRN